MLLWKIVRRPTLQIRSEEHTSELQSQSNLVCRLLLEKNKTSNGPSASPAGTSSRLGSYPANHSPSDPSPPMPTTRRPCAASYSDARPPTARVAAHTHP